MGPDVVESNAVMIVVGSHLRAEECDRPLGYMLKRRIEAWRKRHAAVLTVPLTPIVCSDLWYLNHTILQQRPTVCIGGPGVNTYAAISIQQVDEERPEELSQRDEPRISLMIDPDFTHLQVGIWGTNHELTAKGVELFCDRYLEGYLRACVTQVEPEIE